MKTYNIDMGDSYSGLTLTAKVEADNPEEAARALKAMLDYRLGATTGVGTFEIDGGQLGGSKNKVGTIHIEICTTLLESPDGYTYENDDPNDDDEEDE